MHGSCYVLYSAASMHWSLAVENFKLCRWNTNFAPAVHAIDKRNGKSYILMVSVRIMSCS